MREPRAGGGLRGQLGLATGVAVSILITQLCFRGEEAVALDRGRITAAVEGRGGDLERRVRWVAKDGRWCLLAGNPSGWKFWGRLEPWLGKEAGMEDVSRRFCFVYFVLGYLTFSSTRNSVLSCAVIVICAPFSSSLSRVPGSQKISSCSPF